MDALKAEIEELKGELKKVKEDKAEAERKWKDERNEILINAQEVVTEGEKRMEEIVKDVEKRLKEEMEQVSKNAEEKDTKRQTLVHIKMMTPSVYKEGSSWKDWREEIEDYADEVCEGMAEELKRVRETNREIH